MSSSDQSSLGSVPIGQVTGLYYLPIPLGGLPTFLVLNKAVPGAVTTVPNPCFLIHNGGVIKHSKNILGEFNLPLNLGTVASSSSFPKQKLTTNKFPKAWLSFVEEVFREVMLKDNKEMMCFLYTNGKDWIIEFPNQKSNPWKVSGEMDLETEGIIPRDFRIAGSIHSHLNEAPIPSPDDIEDEAGKDGVHIIIGHLGREFPSYHFEMVSGGQRIPVEKNQFVGINKEDIDIITSCLRPTAQAPITPLNSQVIVRPSGSAFIKKGSFWDRLNFWIGSRGKKTIGGKATNSVVILPDSINKNPLKEEAANVVPVSK